jgi:hypothetical protein
VGEFEVAAARFAPMLKLVVELICEWVGNPFEKARFMLVCAKDVGLPSGSFRNLIASCTSVPGSEEPAAVIEIGSPVWVPKALAAALIDVCIAFGKVGST